MNKEEKKAIEYLRKYTEWETHGERSLETDISTVLNLIQKQDKIIDKMAEQLTTPIHSKEWIIEFFKKEVEDGDREKH